jgi:tRNA-specific 2-thiouridylase
MITKKKGKVFAAMSGGVDSSVAAFLLKRRGYDVVGVFMRCYNVDGCAERDAEDARRVAEKIGIPFYVWDFEEEYKRKVVDYMIQGYKAGFTPNPDVMCNREIKFGLFLARALRAGADYVATGHYVRLATSHLGIGSIRRNKTLNPIGYTLLAARDAQKDQSYFLWTLTQEQLRHCLFPIGDYLKPEVREIARRAGLPTAEKKDSQGICFLGKVTLADFLKQYLPEKRGAVLSLAGEKIGEHYGAHFYTIGQREGIGNVKRQKGVRTHAPLYVAEKDVRGNTVVVAEGADNPALYRREIELSDLNFIRSLPSLIRANRRIRVFARLRYRQPLASAVLVEQKTGDGKQGGWKLVFDKPQKFAAPGQSAVFYKKCHGSRVRGQGKGEYEMLGGGVITAAT